MYIHGDIKSFVSQAGSQILGAAVTRRRRSQYGYSIFNQGQHTHETCITRYEKQTIHD